MTMQQRLLEVWPAAAESDLTFVIGGDAAPRWFDKKGCKQGVLADIVADSKLDIACHDGKELKVLTFDNQFV